MATKRGSLTKSALASKQPLLEVNIKKKKKKAKSYPRAEAAKALLEQYGLCPISMEPMRRPVLPSSGQAFDEINIVRYCSSGKRRCPVSGANLKFNKGRVAHTVDFALRNLIRAQAAKAKVALPAIEKEELFRELRTSFTPETAKAVVDDCYLGHIEFHELTDLLDEFSAGRNENRNENGDEETLAAAFRALLAECFACRRADIVSLAVDYLEVYESAWNDRRVLSEAMAVAQDPDCRGQILVVLEEKLETKVYNPFHIKTMLGFETDSVPVQQFQARVATTIIGHGVKQYLPAGHNFEGVINMALRVREDLEGCNEEDMELYDVWVSALIALRNLGVSMDDATLERLFWRENRMVLHHLAQLHSELLTWHLARHKDALKLCVTALGGNSLAPGLGMDDDVYTSSEDYGSEDDDGHLPYDELEAASGAGYVPSPRAQEYGARVF